MTAARIDGKAPDLAWLARRGNKVSGVELSSIAIEAFFAEQALAFEIVDGPLPAYRARAADITVYCGDFFELDTLECDAHFDRGALIAMPPHRRAAYAEHVDALLAPGARRLVITLEYEQGRVDGPPYSVEPGELLAYWPELERIDARDDLSNAPPKFIEAGLASLTEVVWQSR